MIIFTYGNTISFFLVGIKWKPWTFMNLVCLLAMVLSGLFSSYFSTMQILQIGITCSKWVANTLFLKQAKSCWGQQGSLGLFLNLKHSKHTHPTMLVKYNTKVLVIPDNLFVGVVDRMGNSYLTKHLFDGDMMITINSSMF